ncbi:hypothetical protein DPMN_049989 [Dreissena polymorpha]|uniref:CCHC-type domain-containing protein n=1 Tax=Dreissena polymorpha TaxID=45954 RepID=A0A9D4CGK8_DREPO|nr:hypothetical protein DPMN_049989 [Dreissena polymorpha]
MVYGSGPSVMRRRCFTCGSKLHLRRQCPEKRRGHQNGDKAASRKPARPCDTGKTTSAKPDVFKTQVNALGAGLYLTILCGQWTMSALVDTGAILTVLPSRLWVKLEQKEQMTLEEYGQVLVVASGEALCVKGKTRLKFSIDTFFIF